MQEGIRVTFDAEDAFSPSRAEYSLDAGPWQYIEPVGANSRTRSASTTSLSIPCRRASGIGRPREHLITVRAYDRHDNVGVAKTVIPAQAQ
jgi:hypothetical protein